MPTRNLDDANEVFKYLCDETIVRTIVEFTNIRLSKKNIAADVSIDEFYAYIGILTLLGVLKKRSVDVSEIWNEKSVHYIDVVCATMTRERFKLLSRYITFDDIHTREDRVQTDKKFFKFRQVFNHIRAKCQTAYEPGCHTCVDEELYPFRGRFQARQYMPKKPARYGIKIWQLVDSKTHYLLNFDVYLEKKATKSQEVLERK